MLRVDAKCVAAPDLPSTEYKTARTIAFLTKILSDNLRI